MKKRLYFVETNGYSMIVSVDNKKRCRYLIENNECEFPHSWQMEEEEREAAAIEFLNSVEDDSSWSDNLTYDDLFSDEVMASWNNPDGNVIIAEIQKEL